MNVLDLFSGIGGFSLGLERAGMTTVAFCEIDPFCRRVLARRWPEVPCYEDVRSLDADRLSADGISVDVICGGFPCQDISIAGRGAGLAGERSGLWREYARLIGEIRPAVVIIENVPALLHRGLDQVLRDLAGHGYDAEWHRIGAADVGAPHLRKRMWIVAYADRGQGLEHQQMHAGDGRAVPPSGDGVVHRGGGSAPVAYAHGARLEIELPRDEAERQAAFGACPWSAEPDVGRVAHGVPSRVDRLRSLGNAVVPQIPEIIGRAIMQSTFAEVRS